MMTLSFIFIMDIIGTIAFAASGALVAIHKEMDIFGVNILAITTAVGGGVLRDILMGHIPPEMFRNPFYTLIAVFTANLIFAVLYFNKKKVGKSYINVYERVMFWFDALGLAAFTVDGVSAGINSGIDHNLFLVVFLGVITGVGGGVLRDVMANEMPYIFVKHIYACASILGAVTCGCLWSKFGENCSIVIGFIITILIRMLAAYFKWDLPRVHSE